MATEGIKLDDAHLPSMPLLHDKFAEALHQFNDSLKDFEVLETIDFGNVERPRNPSDSGLIYVLDASFNPPTLAHLSMAVHALQHHLGASYPQGKSARLLLLLATQNADKPSKPASFEDRLIMMHLLALGLRKGTLQCIEPANAVPQAIDIGVTKHPFFTNKAGAIATSGVYSLPMEQVYLLGFDTLIRIFDPKYYPGRKLALLDHFFALNKILVTLRNDDAWGTVAEQREYIQSIRRGSLDSDGGNSSWACRIEVTEGKNAEGTPVSSTKAREAAKAGSLEVMEKLLVDEIREYILYKRLYTE